MKIKPINISVGFQIKDIKTGKMNILKSEVKVYNVTVAPEYGNPKFRINVAANNISELKQELKKMLSKEAIYNLKGY